MTEPVRLPRAREATIPTAKLASYALDPTHARGRRAQHPASPDLNLGRHPVTDCDNHRMAVIPHQILDIVELKVDSGRWPAGTIGTVVESDLDQALVEISDDRGHGLDFVSLPHDALAAHRQPSQQLAS
jgi:hypothetical protein